MDGTTSDLFDKLEKAEAENAKLRADLEQMTKHANEGWALANTSAAKWKAAELQNEEYRKRVADLGCDKPRRFTNGAGFHDFEDCGECLPCKAKQLEKTKCDCGESCHCGKVRNHYCNHKVAEKPKGVVITHNAAGEACCADCGERDYPLSNHTCKTEKRKCEAHVPKKFKTIHGGVVESNICEACGAEMPIRTGANLREGGRT